MKIIVFKLQLIAVLALAILFSDSLIAQETPKIDWQKDLDYLKNELPLLHSNLFFQYPQASFESDLESLKKQIGVISNETMFIKIQQLLSKLGDSHTPIFCTNYLECICRSY